MLQPSLHITDNIAVNIAGADVGGNDVGNAAGTPGKQQNEIGDYEIQHEFLDNTRQPAYCRHFCFFNLTYTMK